MLRLFRDGKKRTVDTEQRQEAVDNLLPYRIASECRMEIKTAALFSERHLPHFYRLRFDGNGKIDFLYLADILRRDETV